MEVMAQLVMVATLVIMITGISPLYITAVVGTTIAAMFLGYDIIGTGEGTVASLVIAAMHPVIVDMLGVLLFIGIMTKCGYMEVIIAGIMDFGRKYGGAPGIATAAGLAAALLGALTSFTQPVVTATVAGPAAVKLGLDPNKTSAIISSANTVANQAGFTHPTMLAILGVTGVQFGLINVYGFLGGIGIYIFAYWRARREMIRDGLGLGKELAEGELSEMDKLPAGHPSFGRASFPFLLLAVLFFSGFPVFLVGMFTGIVVIIMTRMSLADGEKAMISGVGQIAIPIVAIISLMFMSGGVTQSGLVTTLADWVEPILDVAPVQILFIISALAGTMTQSFAASAPILLPFSQILMEMGVDPLAISFAAISGAAIMQLFLTGGALTALPVVAGVVPGTDQKTANRWQRPMLLVGLGISFLLTFIV